METFTKVQHHKKCEICLTFSIQRHEKRSLDKNMNVLKHVFMKFILQNLSFCVGTPDYALDRHSNY